MAKLNTRKRGSKWEYYFESAKIEGKRKRISKGGFNTKREALESGTKALAEYNSAGLPFVPSELSVNDYLDFWMLQHCNVHHKPTTISGYEKKIRLYIKPALGKYKLKALTPSILQTFINDLFNQGFSRNSLSVIKALLSGCLEYAVFPLKYIEHNPMTHIKLPSTRAIPNTPANSKQHVYIPKERISEIFSRFPEGSSTHIPLKLGEHCGLRLGEAFAVVWEDIDFDNMNISINRQVQWHESKKVWYVSNPKYNSFRTIEIDTQLLELLKRQKENQELSKQHYGHYYSHVYVNGSGELNTEGDGKLLNLICVREDGSFINPRTMQHTSRVIHDQLNYPEFDFHSLRVTHATMLAEKNAPPKYVQERLGHKNIQITLQIYQRLSKELKKQGASVLNSLY